MKDNKHIFILIFLAIVFIGLSCCCIVVTLVTSQRNTENPVNPANNENNTEAIEATTIPQNNKNSKQTINQKGDIVTEYIFESLDTQNEQLKYSTPNFPKSDFDSGITSINNSNIPNYNQQYVELNHLILLSNSLKKLEQSNWAADGNFDEKISLAISDLGLTDKELKQIVKIEQNKVEARIIPDVLLGLYDSSEAVAEIEEIAQDAVNEYMAYLEYKNTNQIYIDEVKNNTFNFKENRINYLSENDGGKIPTAVHGVRNSEGKIKDYSTLELDLTAPYIYDASKYITNSKILGEPPVSINEYLDYHRNIRNIAIRKTIYHEMTHVLQRAYMNVHSPEDEKKSKSIQVSAEKSLIDLDISNAWKWSKYETTRDISEEKTRSEERQASGIAFEILNYTYDMSDLQSTALWNTYFGTYNPSHELLMGIKDMFETNWQDMRFKNGFASTLAKGIELDCNCTSEEQLILTKTIRRGTSIASDAGYLDPIHSKDSQEFWDTLKSN